MVHAFRIERYLQNEVHQADPESLAAERHIEVMQELKKLTETIEKGVEVKSESENQLKGKAEEIILEEIEEKRAELYKLKEEMREIYRAIEDTKCQILTIKESGSDGHQIDRVAEELSLIVKGTEEATENILQSAETIDNNASNLVASLQDKSQQELACEIQDNIINIFESCNFQDLTGQRITRVVKTFCFIEQRIQKMMEIWGGPESFLGITPDELEHRQGDGALLNGPALEGESDVASQDDIDALFD